MKQALRVAFGFNAVGGGAARRSTYRDHPGWTRRALSAWYRSSGPAGAAPEDVGGIVAADLRNSGKFNPLDRSRLPQQPTSAEVQPAAGLRWVLTP